MELKCSNCGNEDLDDEIIESYNYQGKIEVSFHCWECDTVFIATGWLNDIKEWDQCKK